jgi:hypothetical protein
MNRSTLSESDFRRLRQELSRRAHETASRIEARVKKVLEQLWEPSDRSCPPIADDQAGDNQIRGSQA